MSNQTNTADTTRRIMSELGLFTSHVEYHHRAPGLSADLPGELVCHHTLGFVYPSNPSVIVRLAPVVS